MNKILKMYLVIFSLMICSLMSQHMASADYTEDYEENYEQDIILEQEDDEPDSFDVWDSSIFDGFGTIQLMSASTVQTYSKASQGNIKLSNNFTVREFACNDGSDTILIDSELVTILQNIRDHFGKAVHINSGYRTASWNAKQGGAKNSYHMRGMAADISISGVSPSTVAAYAETIGVRGIGRYNSFVHVDTRPTKYYWKNGSTAVSTHGGTYNSKPYSTGGGSGGGGSATPATISNIRYGNFDDSGFNIYCDVSGATKVLFPTWTTSDQSDIIWEECEFNGSTANCRINVSAYNWKQGVYITHIYAYNSAGKATSVAAGNVVWPDKGRPSIWNVSITDISASGYTIKCNVADDANGIARVSGASWNDQIGREPAYGGTSEGKTVWFDGSVNGNEATVRVNTSEFGGRTGTYTTHLYAWDTVGNATAYGIHVVVDDYKYNLEWNNFKDNTFSAGGWAIYKKGQNNIRVTVQMDNLSEIECDRRTRTDVHNAFPSYPSGNEGFSITLHGKDLPNGEHTAVIRAYVDNNYVVELGRLKFTSMTDNPPEYTIVRNNHIYSIFNNHIGWSDAQKLAEDKGGYLVTITSSEEQQIVKELLEYAKLAQYWIGATSEPLDDEDSLISWRWLTEEDFNYTNWHQGEPNNDGGKEFYAGIYSNGQWNDFSENATNIGYIMETEISGEPTATIENDGHYYYLYDNEVDWHGAKAFCETMGGHLVTILDAKEQALVQSLAGKGGSDFSSYFIGTTNSKDGSTWKWVTGEDLSYENWNTNQPDNANGIEFYGEMYQNGKWNDRQSYNDTSKNGFILEIEKDDTYTAKEEYNGNTYLRIDKSLSWEDAKKYCELLGGHLATIADEDEQEVIENLLSRGVDTLRSNYAIGASKQSGGWNWITDEQFEYENLIANTGSEKYLTVSTDSTDFGLWKDGGNFNSNPYDIGFICEIEGDKTEPVEPTTEPIVVPDPIIETPAPSDDPVIIDERLSTVTVGTVNAEGGSTVTIPVSISNSQGICESKFVVQYDNTRLTPKQVATGESFNGGSLTTNIESITDEKNSLTVTWENNSIADNINNGEMFSVVFDVAENAAPGIVPITIDKNSLEVINANGDDISINIVSGGAAIAWPIISVGNVTASVGGTVTVPVRIENNTGINAFGFTLEYDNQAMTPVEVTTGNITDGKGNIQSNLQDTSIDWSQQHEVTASWLSDDLVNDISQDGVLFNIKFKIKDNVETGYYTVKLNYTDGDITNAAGAEIGVTTASGGVSVEEPKIMYGDVNGDGKVNIIDIVLLRKYYADLPVDISDDGLLAGDVNLDGKIDSRDILQMRKYVAKWNGIVLGK